MKTKIITLGNWIWIVSEKYRPYFIGTKKKFSPTITGKYLFFHPEGKFLENIAIEEIENNGFDVAKVDVEIPGSGKDHVLCLYYHDDSRKNELAEKYQEKNGIKYRYWKSNSDTKAGKYSKQFLGQLNGTQKRTLP